jgi:hypothetical protein
MQLTSSSSSHRLLKIMFALNWNAIQFEFSHHHHRSKFVILLMLSKDNLIKINIFLIQKSSLLEHSSHIALISTPYLLTQEILCSLTAQMVFFVQNIFHFGTSRSITR